MSYKLGNVLMVVAGILGVLSVTQAWAHRDRGPDDPCRKQIGTSLLHITLYQPHFNPDEEYCEEIPRAGKALLVVDVSPGELRQTPMAVEVMVTDASGQQRTVLSLPPKVYENGVADAELLFEEGYAYTVRVALALANDQAVPPLSFPIQVVPWYTPMVKPALMVIGLVALMIISVIRYRMSAQQKAALGTTTLRRVAD